MRPFSWAESEETMATITFKGKRYYPVGSVYKCQHIFFNEVDRAYNNLYDVRNYGTHDEENKAIDRVDKAEYMLEKFESNPIDKNGIVYALYDDYKMMKDTIAAYAHRHGGRV